LTGDADDPGLYNTVYRPDQPSSKVD
jgi:hypothetical protein